MNDAAVSQTLQASIHLRCCQKKWFSPHFPPYFGTICEHAAEQIEELPQAECYWKKKGIFNLEQFSNAIHHVAIQTIPASSREGETLMPDVQVYASLRRVGSSSLKNGRQSFSSRTTYSN